MRTATKLILGPGMVAIMLLLAVGGCGDSVAPDMTMSDTTALQPETASIDESPADLGQIAHLLVAAVETNVRRETYDPDAVAAILALLTETEQENLVRNRVILVQEQQNALTISAVLRLDPEIANDGVFVTTYTDASWGRVKCCAKDEKCCLPQKKKDG